MIADEIHSLPLSILHVLTLENIIRRSLLAVVAIAECCWSGETCNYGVMSEESV